MDTIVQNAGHAFNYENLRIDVEKLRSGPGILPLFFRNRGEQDRKRGACRILAEPETAFFQAESHFQQYRFAKLFIIWYDMHI